MHVSATVYPILISAALAILFVVAYTGLCRGCCRWWKKIWRGKRNKRETVNCAALTVPRTTSSPARMQQILIPPPSMHPPYYYNERTSSRSHYPSSSLHAINVTTPPPSPYSFLPHIPPPAYCTLKPNTNFVMTTATNGRSDRC